MTDGISAGMRDMERGNAHILLRYEIRRFAMGERSEGQRNKIVTVAQACDSLIGKGLITFPSTATAQIALRKLDKIVARDKAAWLKLADTWHSDTSDFYSIGQMLRKDTDKAFLEGDTYESFRLRLRDEANVPTSALLFFPDEFGRWSVGFDLREMIKAELRQRGWRDGHQRTHDRYVAILGQDFRLDLVWLGHYYLDAHNLTPDVALGPEVSRLATSKRSVA